MTPDRWPAVRALFEAALALEQSSRQAYLDEHCRDNPQLRKDVQTLLDADDLAASAPLAIQAPDILQALSDSAQAEASQALIGTRLGAWRLVRELGRGGMGAVYLAERDDGEYRQLAAVKMMLPGWNARELIERFKAERQMLANLNHPNIARLLDGGMSEQGAPYLVLEYVQGEPIDHYCDARSLSIRERLKLFALVCEAVAHAHRALIVHRDLKPSNIFVSADGVVKLLDFGIAKLLPSAGLGLAQSQTRVFTPEFAAPEQVRGEPPTTGVDVYALGVLLFALLTGKRPYGRTAETPAAYEQAILNVEPDRPSRAAAEIDASFAKNRGLSPPALGKALRGDLDAIVLKALRKDSSHRYASVDAFAEDVKHFLASEPVDARRGNWRYGALRFVQRHALASVLSLLVVLSLLTGFGLALWQAKQAQIARARAEVQAQQAGAVAQFMTRVFTQADPQQAGSGKLSAQDLLDQGMRNIDAQPTMNPSTRTALLLAIGQAYSKLGELSLAEKTLIAARDSAKSQSDVLSEFEATIELGIVVGGNQRNDEALALLQDVELRMLAMKDSGETRIQSLRQLLDARIANQLNSMRRERDALPYLERAFAASKTLFGETSVQRSELLPLYVIVLSTLGRKVEALKVAEQSYAAARADARLPTARVKGFAEALAFAYLNQGHYAQAEQSFRDLLAIEERIYGAGQIQTSSTVSNIAVTLLRQERYASAGELFEQVLAIRQRFLDPNDVRIARAFFNAASGKKYALELNRAKELNIEGLALWDRSGATPDDLYMSAILSLAEIQEELGELVDAETTAKRLRIYTHGALKNYASRRMDRILVLVARLEDRLNRTTPACTAANDVFASTRLRDSVRIEALVLKAHCEKIHGMKAQSRQTLAQLSTDAEALKALSPYTARLHQNMLRQP